MGTGEKRARGRTAEENDGGDHACAEADTAVCRRMVSGTHTGERKNGEHARLDDEVRHCNPFQPRAPRRAGRVSEWTGDITRQRSGRAETYSSGQTADSSVSGCVSPGHKFNLPFVRRCSHSTWVSVLRTWSKVGESELWALKGPTGVVNVPEPRASVWTLDCGVVS